MIESEKISELNLFQRKFNKKLLHRNYFRVMNIKT